MSQDLEIYLLRGALSSFRNVHFCYGHKNLFEYPSSATGLNLTFIDRR